MSNSPASAPKAPFPAAILAGGKSSRMGRDKSFLPVLGVPIISLVAGTLREYFQEVFVISNEAAPFASLGLRVVADVLPGNDSLGGLHTAVSTTHAPHVFVTACDMTFLQPALMAGLAARAEGWDVVIPINQGYPEPLCAVYSAACEAPIRGWIERKELKVIKFFDEVRVLRIEEDEWRGWDPEGLSFRNINTPAEYQDAVKLGKMGLN